MPHFDVFYMRPDFIKNGLLGYKYCKLQNKVPDPKALGVTHTYVKMLEAESLDDVFHKMLGEVWSPNGEARPLMEYLGLNHTSMCVGDVVVSEDGIAHMVDMFGFKPLNGVLKLMAQ